MENRAFDVTGMVSPVVLASISRTVNAALQSGDGYAESPNNRPRINLHYGEAILPPFTNATALNLLAMPTQDRIAALPMEERQTSAGQPQKRLVVNLANASAQEN